MDMLILDTRKPVNDLGVAEPSYRLYACQTNVMYSRPQFFDGKICFVCMMGKYESAFPSYVNACTVMEE